MLSKVLGVAGRLLIVAGLVILGFVAYQLWGTGLEESRQQDELLDEYAQSIGADWPTWSHNRRSARTTGHPPTLSPVSRQV